MYPHVVDSAVFVNTGIPVYPPRRVMIYMYFVQTKGLA